MSLTNPAATLTVADIARRVAALGYPENWTAADDVALMEGLFESLSLQAIADRTDQRTGNVKARWQALKAAAGAPHGGVPVDAQNALLGIVRDRADRGVW